MASDLQTVIADQQFAGFSPDQQRTILATVSGDSGFKQFSDDDVRQFVTRATAKIQSTRPDLMPPPGVPRPQVNMQSANFAPQPPTSYQTTEPAPTSGLAGWEYRHPAGAAAAEVGGIAALGAGAAEAAPVAPEAVKAVSEMAKAHPFAASLVKKAIVGLGGAEAYKHGKWLMDILP